MKTFGPDDDSKDGDAINYEEEDEILSDKEMDHLSPPSKINNFDEDITHSTTVGSKRKIKAAGKFNPTIV